MRHVPRFDGIATSPSVAHPGPDGVIHLTVPAGVASVGLWRSEDGQRLHRQAHASEVSTSDARVYDLSDDIEVSLDGGPRQKKRDGRLSIPIAGGEPFFRRLVGRVVAAPGGNVEPCSLVMVQLVVVLDSRAGQLAEVASRDFSERIGVLIPFGRRVRLGA